LANPFIGRVHKLKELQLGGEDLEFGKFTHQSDSDALFLAMGGFFSLMDL